MINFFRKIRKQLADQNKPLKYFRYAVGEIVLVMVGILLALQVNNWNEERKGHLELTNIIRGVKKDLKGDVLEFEWAIEQIDKENLRIKSFLKHQDYTGFTRDSLEQALETFSTSMEFITGNYDKLINSGITDYGEYEEIIKSIRSYYEYYIPSIKGYLETNDYEITRSDDYWRFEQSAYEFTFEKELSSAQSDSAGKAALVTLLKSPVPRNILKLSYRRNKQFSEIFSDFLEALDRYDQRIEEALKENE